jgi:hypothetical protein
MRGEGEGGEEGTFPPVSLGVLAAMLRISYTGFVWPRICGIQVSRYILSFHLGGRRIKRPHHPSTRRPNQTSHLF